MNLQLLLEMAASGHPDRVALGERVSGVTFQQLAERASACASVVAKGGPSHVVYLGRNGTPYPQLLFGAALAGIPFVPLNYRLGREQLESLLAELERPLVVVDRAYEQMIRPHIRSLSTEELIRSLARARVVDSFVPAHETAVVLYTSGTTAQPKGVALKHSNLTSYVMSTVEFGVADADEAALIAVPPYHVAALTSVLSNVYAGRRVVYLADFDPEAWVATARREGVTSAMLVPTMFSRIVDFLGDQRAAIPSLRQIAYGGSRTPRRLVERAMDLFPDVGFVNAYGLTETSSTIALLDPDDHREARSSQDPRVRARLASIGRPLPNVEVQIRSDHGRLAKPHEVGTLWVRGGQVSGVYRGQPSALDADGWFSTRDRCYADDDGYLFIEGRADDTIIRGGENIAPAEIEDVLLTHPGVGDAAVVGVADDEWGERILAVIVPRAHHDPQPDDIREYVRRRLRGSRTPDAIAFRSELPYTATGKLLRRHLVEELQLGGG